MRRLVYLCYVYVFLFSLTGTHHHHTLNVYYFHVYLMFGRGVALSSWVYLTVVEYNNCIILLN